MRDAKCVGVVPARMAASRFPGKPLKPILGMPMLEHVYRRALLYREWDTLVVATCDEEIREFCNSKGFPVVMTSPEHTRALDRVAEAAQVLEPDIADDDVIINVQGDEPMLRPDMIDVTRKPFQEAGVDGVLLSMDIRDESLYYDPNTLKIVHNLSGDILYTSRSPIPYAKHFTPELGAKRIYGIFAFRWRLLRTFTELDESPLEIKEACDSNRLYDNGLTQRIAPYPYTPSFAVDSPEDLARVEEHLPDDPLWKEYSKYAGSA